MWDGHDGMGWWMLWGSILWVVFIVAIVVVTARLSGDGRRADNTRQPPPEAPLDIARRRYASGELSREEFEQIRRDLS
jgi:putative membrane protein